MTSRESTRLLALPSTTNPQFGSDGAEFEALPHAPSHTMARLAFGAIGWPWLLRSLWGGTQASKRRLLERLDLAPDALPNLGSWKADTGFLHRIVDTIEELRPRVVVELGAGASSLVCARALERNGGGRLVSYDQHGAFVGATQEWLREEGVGPGIAQIRHAPLVEHPDSDWPGAWYDLHDVPASIDLLIIDGPPWSVHPFVRGAADSLFDRLSERGVVLLDDAARPGERIVARRWAKRWPGMTFERLGGSSKGTLVGRRRANNLVHLPTRQAPVLGSGLRRAAAVIALFGAGWLAHDAIGPFAAPVAAAGFVNEAEASYEASRVRQSMVSQPESTRLDRAEIRAQTGLELPVLPAGWQVLDVQVYPADSGPSVSLTLRAATGEQFVLFAQRAETPAEASPLVETTRQRAVAFWEAGPFAYALTGELAPARVLALASDIAGQA